MPYKKTNKLSPGSFVRAVYDSIQTIPQPFSPIHVIDVFPDVNAQSVRDAVRELLVGGFLTRPHRGLYQLSNSSSCHDKIIPSNSLESIALDEQLSPEYIVAHCRQLIAVAYNTTSDKVMITLVL